MKTTFIAEGESRSYESLVTDNLIVKGYLNVVNDIKARHISGHGIITAGAVSADVITADMVETSTIVCKRLMAKRVYASQIYATDCAVVSGYLNSAYVETGKLTTTQCQVDEVNADEVVHLRPNRHGMIFTLLLSALRSLWLSLTAPRAPESDAESGSDQDVREPMEASDWTATEEKDLHKEIAEIVREILTEQKAAENEDADEDEELMRFISIFKLLRGQRYTLRIIPGTPEENAPFYDAETEEFIRPAA